MCDDIEIPRGEEKESYEDIAGSEFIKEEIPVNSYWQLLTKIVIMKGRLDHMNSKIKRLEWNAIFLWFAIIVLTVAFVATANACW